MRADLDAAVIAAVFLFAGYGVLAGCGLSTGERRSSRLGMVGLAYMTGLSCILLIGLFLIVIGIGVTVPIFIAVGFLIGECGFGVRVARRGTLRARSRPTPRPALPSRASIDATWAWARRRPVAIGVGAGALAIALLGYRWAQTMPLSEWDAWSIWARKAIVLYDYGTPKLQFFATPLLAYTHQDYPLLVPLLESIWFRFVGSADTTSLHIEFWLFYLASLGAAGWIASRVSPARIWVPAIGFIAFLPALTFQIASLYADVPMALLLMLGVLLVGRWFADRRPAYLILGALFLAACANAKNEGLTYGVVTLAAAFLCTVIVPERGRRLTLDLRSLVLVTVLFAVLIAPWRIFLAVHHITGDIPIGKGLDPAYVIGRDYRIPPTLTALYGQIDNQGQWTWLLPIGAGLALACLLSRRLRRQAGFYALAGLGVFAMVVWAYDVGTDPLGWWLGTSDGRTIDGVMCVAAAAILGLSGDALRPHRPPADAGWDEDLALGSDADVGSAAVVRAERDLTVRS